MIVAIVPAAGKSERMGRPKLLLPLGSQTVLEHVLTALAASPVDRTLVVLPPGAGDIAAVVHRFDRAQAIELHEPTHDMRASIQVALDQVPAIVHPQVPQAFLLAPADQPLISPRVIQCLVDRFQREKYAVVIPTYQGKRGHPVLFAWSLVERIRALPVQCGINHLVADLQAEVAECAQSESGILADVDTPEDYERLQMHFG